MNPFLTQVAEGITAPARSARRRIQADDGFGVVILMVLLAYFVIMIFTGLMTDTFAAREQSPIAFHIRSFFLKCAEFFVIGAAVFSVGKLFSGVGTRSESYTVVAWHTLVTSFLSPLFLMGQDAIKLPAPGADPSQVPQADGLKLVLVLIFACLWIWLLAKYVAELHGFKSIGTVVVGVVVTQFCFGFLALIFLPAFMG